MSTTVDCKKIPVEPHEDGGGSKISVPRLLECSKTRRLLLFLPILVFIPIVMTLFWRSSIPEMSHITLVEGNTSFKMGDGCAEDSFLPSSRTLVPGELPACILAGDAEKVIDVEYSIIVIVFNQEELIREVLKRIFAHTVEPYELIIVFDYCLDRSVQVVVETLEEFGYQIQPKSIIGKQHIILLNHPTPAFETTATNTGLRMSQGQYAILVQDDVLVNSQGWNRRLSLPARCFDDVVGVTARKAHSFRAMVDLVGSEGSSDAEINILQVRDTCNRGPVLLRMDYVRKLQYFDEINFFLEWDEHDFFARAWHFYNYVCGFFPGVQWEHSHEHSGMRSNKKAKATALSDWIKLYRSKTRGNGFVDTLDPSGDSTHNEERSISESCPELLTHI